MTAITESPEKRFEQRQWLAKFCYGLGLDVGCGAKKISEKAVGIDLGILSGRQPELISRAYELPFASGSLDFIVSCHLLEHIADTKRALAEFWRVLKLDGACSAIVPDGERFSHAVSTVEHLSAFTPLILREFFRACGFEIKEEAEFLEGHSICLGIAAKKTDRSPRYRPEGENGFVWLSGSERRKGRIF